MYRVSFVSDLYVTYLFTWSVSLMNSKLISVPNCTGRNMSTISHDLKKTTLVLMDFTMGVNVLYWEWVKIEI